MFPLLKVGFETPLEVEDLTAAPPSESAKKQFDRFIKFKARSIIVQCLLQNWQLITLAGFARLLADLSSLAGAVCIKWIVQSLSQNQTDTLSLSEMSADEMSYDEMSWESFLSQTYVISVLMLLAGICQGTLSQSSSHLLTVAASRSQSALQVHIYQKSLRLAGGKKSTKESSENLRTDEGNLDISFVLSLVTEDCANVREFLLNVHYFWALPLKIAAILYLVQGKIGLSGTLGGAVGILIVVPMQLFTGKLMSNNNQNICHFHDERLLKSTELVKGMKTVKLTSTESKMLERINSSRDQELKFLKIDSYCWSGMTFLASVSTILMASVTIGIHSATDSDQLLSSGDIFSTLALFNQLAVCLSIFPAALPVWVKGLKSKNRIIEFMDRQEIVDYKSEITSKSSLAFEVTNASFSWPTDVSVLSNISIQISRGSLTVIAGTSGSGKSALIMALIEEMKLNSGHVKWFVNPRIAFVSQNSWLISSSIRDNIIMGQPFKEKRYFKVLAACDLDVDVALLPKGDLTHVGDNGSLLSGGQRQRLAIARGLYSKAPCTFLDSPFSALDADLSNSIFERGIERILKKRNRTIVLTTDRLNFMERANKIIFIDNGEIQAQGSYADMMKERPELFEPYKTGKASDCLVESRTAQERWKLLKNVTRWGINSKQSTLKMDEPKKEFGQSRRRESRLKEGNQSQRKRFRGSRKNSLVQSVARSALLRNLDPSNNPPPDLDGVKRTLLGERTSIVSIDHHRTSIDHHRTSIVSIDHHRTSIVSIDHQRTGDSFALRRMMSTESTTGAGSVFGYNFVHKFVQRLSSTASDISEISGFSDDSIDEEDEMSGLILSSNSWDSNEPRQYGLISAKVFLSYLRCGGLLKFSLFVVAAFAFECSKVYMDFLLRDWSVSSQEENYNQSTTHYIAWYFGLSGSVLFFSFATNLLSQSVSAVAREKMHSNMLKHIVKAPLDFFEAFSIARIINRLSCDVFCVDQKLPSCIQRLTLVLFICISSLCVNILLSPWCSLVVIPMVGLYLWLQYFYRRTSLELQRLHSSSRIPLMSHVCDTLGGLVTIRAYKIQQRFVNELGEAIDQHTSAYLLLQASVRWLGLSLDLLGTVFVFVSIVINLSTGPGAASVGTWQPASVALAVNYSLLVPIYLSWVVKFFAELENNMGAVERIVDYLSIEQEPDPQTNSFVGEKLDCFREDIYFNSAAISHTSDPRSVIQVHLKIPSRQKLAICGRSGSGKSTLLMTLVRTTKVSAGAITLGPENLNSIPLKVLRMNVMALAQDGVLFSGSIRENIDPHERFEDPQIWKCLEHLNLIDWVKSLKDQLKTHIEELGNNLTASERQLVNLARILLYKPPIILLDEATNSLDAKDEIALHSKLLDELKSSTLITVTHRLATIINYDRVLVLGNGKILEDGNPKDLLKKSVGFFSSLWKASGEE